MFKNQAADSIYLFLNGVSGMFSPGILNIQVSGGIPQPAVGGSTAVTV